MFEENVGGRSGFRRPRTTSEGGVVTEVKRRFSCRRKDSAPEATPHGYVRGRPTERVNLKSSARPETKPSDFIAGLARKMGTTYRKPIHAPLIAEALSDQTVAILQSTFADFL